jgi:chromosome segregation ATPase
VVDDIRHRQDHIEFLENYITELTEKIEEITGGKDYLKRISSIEYRIDVLKKAGNKNFNPRIKDLESQLVVLKGEYIKIKPIMDELETERTYYRSLQGEL